MNYQFSCFGTLMDGDDEGLQLERILIMVRGMEQILKEFKAAFTLEIRDVRTNTIVFHSFHFVDRT
ncbi:hypothetical protein HL658_20045 [Azospirillum sp. RWY-5-1]|uniref:Uncharacterized protein n=1 Tax=Azospirillum oleiclasticum TaxID=2735135 RepID=A0ABX2TCY4_9PROT|nr:hypothetical protein [Azospirillum oleiclasticum]NYZ14844.1 hypothetical protein [Azospirillum oleiclasticum]NYZ22170.1 hypothetical protein [Azospirillum oleiclasticum]